VKARSFAKPFHRQLLVRRDHLFTMSNIALLQGEGSAKEQSRRQRFLRFQFKAADAGRLQSQSCARMACAVRCRSLFSTIPTGAFGCDSRGCSPQGLCLFLCRPRKCGAPSKKGLVSLLKLEYVFPIISGARPGFTCGSRVLSITDEDYRLP
jgi:hypothetical protein